MTTTRAAKYLAPIDIGKTITITDANTGKTVTGELQSIDAIGYNIELGIIAGKDSGEYRVNYDAEVALTGQPSPDGWDQPAQALPAPIPAAQAADHAGHVPHFTVNEDGSIEQHLELHIDDSKLRAAAALAAKRDDLKIHTTVDPSSYYGPSCCIGDCCGPGSYCCTHPENNHLHDNDTILGHTTVDAVLGSDCGHNGGQSIGAGHTCACIRTADHPLDSDRPHACPCGALWADTPEHEHIATLQNPEHCTRCDAVLEYDENGNRK